MFCKRTLLARIAVLPLTLFGCNAAEPTIELTLEGSGDFASRRICVPREHIAHIMSLISTAASVHAVGRYQWKEGPQGKQVTLRAVSREEYFDPKADGMLLLGMRVGSLAYGARFIRTVSVPEKAHLPGTILVEQYLRGDGQRYLQDRRVYRGTGIATGTPGSFEIKCDVRNGSPLPPGVRRWCDVAVQVDEGLIADFTLRQPWLNRVPQVAARVTQLVHSYERACVT